MRVAAPDAADASEATLQGFVDDCTTEGDIDVDDLPVDATRQAAEDLELARRHLGADQLALAARATAPSSCRSAQPRIPTVWRR